MKQWFWFSCYYLYIVFVSLLFLSLLLFLYAGISGISVHPHISAQAERSVRHVEAIGTLPTLKPVSLSPKIGLYGTGYPKTPYSPFFAGIGTIGPVSPVSCKPLGACIARTWGDQSLLGEIFQKGTSFFHVLARCQTASVRRQMSPRQRGPGSARVCPDAWLNFEISSARQCACNP